MVAVTSPSANEVLLRLELRGGNEEFWNARDPEIVYEGPRGTGKTRTVLELMNALAHGFPGFSGLIVRKYQKTLATTCLKTFREQVIHNGDGVVFFGGNEQEPSAYRYPEGSSITLGGMDNAEKHKSGEYDFIYANEATELTADDITALKALLRHVVNGKPVIENQRLVMDCNPANLGHHLNVRCDEGRARRIRTKLIDNPLMADSQGKLTPFGESYLANLPHAGPQRDRWVLGLWTGTENAIYPTFDRAVHVCPLPKNLRWVTGAIGADQGRIHSAAAVVVRVDEYGRRWVVEAWGEPDPEEGELTARNIGRLSIAHGITRVRTDPTGAKIALATSRILGNGGQVNAAEGSPGARLARIRMTQRLLTMWPGGRVPTIWQEQNQQTAPGVWVEEESPGLLFIEGAPGIGRLIDQVEGYHFVHIESEIRDERVVARIDDDLVAGMEYGIEELETIRAVLPRSVGRGQQSTPATVRSFPNA